MWIKWKYNDHGHPDFVEAEIPDNLDGESSVKDYICQCGWVPTWSERFMSGRIEWKKLKHPSKKAVEKQIAYHRRLIKSHQNELNRFKKLLLEL